MTDDTLSFHDIGEAEALLSSLESDQSEGPGRFVAKSLSEVAEFFGLHIQTVKQWRQESPAMPGSEGNWDLAQIVRWRHAKIMQTDVLQSQRTEALESTRLKNEQLRLAIAQKNGELIAKDEVELDIRLAISRLNNHLASLGHAVSLVVPGDKAQTIATVDEVVRRAMREVSDSLSQIGDSPEDEESEDTNG